MNDFNKRIFTIAKGLAQIDYSCLNELPSLHVILKCDESLLFDDEVKQDFEFKLPQWTKGKFISFFVKMNDECFFIDKEFNAVPYISTKVFSDDLMEEFKDVARD